MKAAFTPRLKSGDERVNISMALTLCLPKAVGFVGMRMHLEEKDT
jgi:hypothetical protein